jgi:hypothetical protein
MVPGNGKSEGFGLLLKRTICENKRGEWYRKEGYKKERGLVN